MDKMPEMARLTKIPLKIRRRVRVKEKVKAKTWMKLMIEFSYVWASPKMMSTRNKCG